MFYLITIGFALNLLMDSSMFTQKYGIGGVSFMGFTFISSFLLIIYIFTHRINSLGGKVPFDSGIKIALPLGGLLAILITISGIINVFELTKGKVVLYISFSLFLVSSILELYLVYLLFSKVKIMLEYRNDLRQLVKFKIILYTVIIFILEASFLFFHLYYNELDIPEGHIRVFTNNFRLFTVVDFYRDIIKGMSPLPIQIKTQCDEE